MPVDPTIREKAVASLLDEWPWDLGGVIIGGYVSAAYGKPRYSNDIDVVIPVDALQPLLTWLQARDPPFTIEQMPTDLEQNYAGKIARGSGSPTLPRNVKTWNQFQKMVRAAIPF